jgi:hypothetical protein
MLDPFTMQMGMMGVQALMGANQAEEDAWKQMSQKSWNDHLKRMEVTKQNYHAAESNAAQWMQNTLISEQAYTNAAEEQVYLKYNFDNETGQLSRHARNTYDTITHTLSTRNIKGGTARALMNQQQNNDKKIMEARAITHGNQMRDTERRRDQTLAKRNFGYTRQNEFVAGLDLTDPKGAFSNALTSGLMQAGVAGYGMHQQQTMMAGQQNYQTNLYNMYGSQANPGGWTNVTQGQLFGGPVG